MSPHPSRGMCLEAWQFSLRPFPLCLVKCPQGEEWPLTLQVPPLGLRYSSPGEETPFPLQDTRTNQEPGLREPTVSGRAKSSRVVRV